MTKQKTIKSYCKETNQSVTITSFGISDDSTCTFIPNKHNCSHQKTCEVYINYKDQSELCPLQDQIHKKYISQLGPTS